MMGQYMMFYGNGMNWVGMIIMMLGIAAGWILLLAVLWKNGLALQSIARSMEEMTNKLPKRPDA